MPKTFFNAVKISGISEVVPEKEINIYDEAQYYGNDVKKIDRMRKMVGFFKRRVSDKENTPSDYAIQAAQILIKEMNIDKSEIDALVYVVQRPDFRSPATAYYIHNKLNLSEKCSAFDITQSCPGWVYGLWVCAQMVQSKACRKVLLLAADTASIGISKNNRIVAPVFGDAGTATLVEYCQDAKEMWFNIETFSKDYEAIMAPASGMKFYLNNQNKADEQLRADILNNPIQTPFGHTTTVFDWYMDGQAVFDFTISKVPPNIKELMDYANSDIAAIDYLCLHQANKQIVCSVAKAAGFPQEKAPYYSFENYGNNTICSIPTVINTTVKENKKGVDAKLIAAAFGGGLGVACALLTLDKDCYLSGVRDWVKPDDFVTKEQYLQYWNKKLKGEL
jgi:3-oxoacyl-[acyl-carrier-protein] synthase-3